MSLQTCNHKKIYLYNFCFLIVIQHNSHWCYHLICWAPKVSQTVSPVTWWEEVRSSEWHKSTQRRPAVRYCLIFEFKATFMFSTTKVKVSFFVQCIKKQLITLQNFHIQTCFSQFLWIFRLECWFKGQIISRSLNSQYFWKWTNANPMKIFRQCASHPKLLIGSKLSLG